MSTTTKCYAAESATTPLIPFEVKCRELLANDVAFDVLYCGVCHSDLHQARNDWKGTTYPIVPGHEVVGKVTAVGEEVEKFKVGEIVAVGCMVDACLGCKMCHKDLEQYCSSCVFTYNSPDKHMEGQQTYGGYCKHIVVREEFVLKVPETLDASKVGPLLCAGITTYSPLRTWNVGPGSKVGVVGLGGLGHMAVKFASALGAHVTVFSRTPDKQADAQSLGADSFVISTDADAMKAIEETLDVIIDTIPVQHEVDSYMPTLVLDGTLVIVGQIGDMTAYHSQPFVFRRRRLAGSLIGGIAETQEMLDFCGRTGVLPEVEMIKMEQINEAYERMLKSDVHYRFVIDMSSF